MQQSDLASCLTLLEDREPRPEVMSTMASLAGTTPAKPVPAKKKIAMPKKAVNLYGHFYVSILPYTFDHLWSPASGE